MQKLMLACRCTKATTQVSQQCIGFKLGIAGVDTRRGVNGWLTTDVDAGANSISTDATDVGPGMERRCQWCCKPLQLTGFCASGFPACISSCICGTHLPGVAGHILTGVCCCVVVLKARIYPADLYMLRQYYPEQPAEHCACEQCTIFGMPERECKHTALCGSACHTTQYNTVRYNTSQGTMRVAAMQSQRLASGQCGQRGMPPLRHK